MPGELEIAAPDAHPRPCTNPLTWRPDGAAAPATADLGAVFLESDDPRPRPAFADAQCVDGLLMVRTVGARPRDFMSRVLDHALAPTTIPSSSSSTS